MKEGVQPGAQTPEEYHFLWSSPWRNVKESQREHLWANPRECTYQMVFTARCATTAKIPKHSEVKARTTHDKSQYRPPSAKQVHGEKPHFPSNSCGRLHVQVSRLQRVFKNGQETRLPSAQLAQKSLHTHIPRIISVGISHVPRIISMGTWWEFPPNYLRQRSQIYVGITCKKGHFGTIAHVYPTHICPRIIYAYLPPFYDALGAL